MPSRSHGVRRVVLYTAGFALGVVSCMEPVATPPREQLAGPPASPPALQPAPAFPPLSRAGTIYAGAEDLYARYFAYLGSTMVSRYVLYDDGTFGLQFSSQRFGYYEYTGRLVRGETLLTFAFDGSSTAGPWIATGTLVGDLLSVSYNELMQHSDFVDGVYVRAR